MRNLFTLLMVSLLTVSMYGQSASRSIKNLDQVRSNEYRQIDHTLLADPPATSINSPTAPIGTVTSDAVTSVKIGEASNAFTALLEANSQLSLVSSVGTNGGSIAFIHRHNIAQCGGMTEENGVYRFSISTDGGMSWNVSAGTNTVGNPPAAGCYGLGPLNPNYTRASRYPNIGLFLPPDSTGIENLAVVYAGPILSGGAALPWDGPVVGMADSAGLTPVVRQEDYPYLGGNHFWAYSLVERVAGEFFYLSYTWDGTDPLGDIHVNKGIYNATTGIIDWTIVQTITPNFFLGFDGTNQGSSAGLSIGFGPDGSVGWIGALLDLVGGTDSAYQVCFSKSIDGGQTWGTMVEFDMNANVDFVDSMHFFTDTTAMGDTVDFSGNYPSTGFGCDMVVDKNNNPHLITVVTHGSIHNGDGTYSDPSYSVWATEMMILDFTYDTFGDLNMLYLAWQDFFRGDFGTAGTTVSPDPFIQASRSEDGRVIFFSWTDSDPDIVTTGNDAPDLFTAAYDVDLNMMTPVVNRTSDDGVWAGAVLFPHASDKLIENGTVYTLPIQALTLDANDGGGPTSFWYFTDVTYDLATDFTETPMFFYNCKQNPFSNAPTIISPDCGVSDGSVAIAAGGGIGPYEYQWDAGAGSATTDSVFGLNAGIYEVVVTDSKACKDTISVIVNNANAPTLAVSGEADITCFGANDGTATITPSGGAGSETYAWSNGETAATAIALPPGPATVTVTDANGCTAFSTVNIAEPVELTGSATSIDVLCNGEMTGEASATALGGTGALSYAWDNGSAGPVQSSLLAGTYTVTITDVNGCSIMSSATIMEPDALTSSLTTFSNSDASVFTGSILASIAGGVGAPNYQFRWTGPDGYDTTAVNYTFPQGLCGGTYYLEVTDGNGCVLLDTAVVGIEGEGVNCPDAAFIFPPASSGVNNISVFPNPSSGSFFLSVELDKLDDMTIEVLNFRGQIITTRSAERVRELDESFDLSGEAAGIYMVKVTTSRGSATEKIMIR